MSAQVTEAHIAFWKKLYDAAATDCDQLLADRNNLRADLDAIKAILTEEKARAERAEAELAEQKYIKRSAVKRANELTEELATERARLDWLEDNAGDIPKYNSRSFIWSANQNLCAAMDAAMKEESK